MGGYTMRRLLSNRNLLIFTGLAGLLLGLLLGMLFFWVLFPVKWTDAHSYDLAPEAKAEHVALVADSFRLDKDPDHALKYLAQWTPEEKSQGVAGAIQMYEDQARPDKVLVVQDMAMALGIDLPDDTALPEEPEAETTLLQRLWLPCLVFFVVLAVLGLAFYGIRFAMRQRAAAQSAQPVARRMTVTAPSEEEQVDTMQIPAAPPAEDWEGVGQPPLKHFLATYELGETSYDESFSVETPLGEFLGECGVSHSEIIGEGEPDRVTAFEIWLFDKDDIRTVTKVLMSEHAFRDDALRARLSERGEHVLAQTGSPFLLETKRIQVRAEVVELVYGKGELPPKSFFEKLTLELVAMPKVPGSDETILE
jgi:hypothetical protein